MIDTIRLSIKRTKHYTPQYQGLRSHPCKITRQVHLVAWGRDHHIRSQVQKTVIREICLEGSLFLINSCSVQVVTVVHLARRLSTVTDLVDVHANPDTVVTSAIDAPRMVTMATLSVNVSIRRVTKDYFKL